MAEIKDFNSLFRLDGKVAVVTGGRSISVSASLLVMSLEFLSTSLLKGPLQSQDLKHFLGVDPGRKFPTSCSYLRGFSIGPRCLRVVPASRRNASRYPLIKSGKQNTKLTMNPSFDRI